MKSVRHTLSTVLLIWMVTLFYLSSIHSGHRYELGIEAPGICAVNCEETSHHNHKIDCLWTVTQLSKWGMLRTQVLISHQNFANFIFPVFEKTVVTFLPLTAYGRAPPPHLL